MQDYHLLPKLRDSLSYLYIEHAIVERSASALLVLQETGRTTVPVANLCLLLLGPGTSITHAAVRVLAENGCSAMWVGEDMQKFYAQGVGETHRAYHLIRQAELVSAPEKRLRVVMRMYEKRFGYPLQPEWTLEQIRGFEGVRVRTAYQEASRKFGVPWEGRNYDLRNWNRGDPVNRALSAANAVLNGLCHAAIISGGYSPALGFLHTGKQLSFVYDIADLYKTTYTIPMAFEAAAEGADSIEKRVRQACREKLREEKLLEKILPDIDDLLEISTSEMGEVLEEAEPGLPVAWWDPVVEGGEVYGSDGA